MITQITMDMVASFKQSTSLDTDKKINLVYGLNGTGKSTISNFLYEPNDLASLKCQKTQTQPMPILVYNQKFVRDNFFVADNLKGIFSLSTENKIAEQRIAEGTKKQAELKQLLQSKQSAKTQTSQEFATQKQQAVEEVWNIKKTYTGGDRVLEYCLEGLKAQKDKLFAYLQGIPKPANEPDRGVEALRKDVESLKGDDAQLQQRLTALSFQAYDVETDPLLETAILGNTDSEIATLIERLGNADWINQGLAYLPVDTEVDQQCPFCQQSTITTKFVENVKSYFDESYQDQLDALTKLLQKYRAAIGILPKIDEFTNHPFAQEDKNVFLNGYQLFTAALRKNVQEIERKIKSPKVVISLTNTVGIVADFNKHVALINQGNRQIQQ